MRIILPKTLVDIPTRTKARPQPLFFLAGPIKGGGDWQATMCDTLEEFVPDCFVVVPCRWKEDHRLFEKRAFGHENSFDRQLPWERYYLDLAAHFGCIVFWLPCESRTNPRDDGRPYADETRGELGEWRGRMIEDKDLRVVIGAEPEFPGLDAIRRNFGLAIQTDFPIEESIGKTAFAATKKAQPG